MDEQDFERDIFNSIVSLLPDAEDIMGKQVLLKMDSCTGHLNPTLLAML